MRFLGKKREKPTKMKEEDYTKELRIEKEQFTERYRKSETCDMFGLVKTDEGNVKIVMGECVASENEFATFKDAEEYIAAKPYEFIYNMICIILYYEKKIKTQDLAAKN